MADIWISEYGGLVMTSNGLAQAVREPALTRQKFTFTTSTQSNAFNTNTKILEIVADADVYLEFGSNPTATVNSRRIPADTIIYTYVQPGNKLAAYDGVS